MTTMMSRPKVIFSLLALMMAAAPVRCGGGYDDGTVVQLSPQQPSTAFTTPSGHYVSTYDNIDVGRLLRNNRLVSSYIKCIVNEGLCTPEGRLVRAYLLPDIIRTVCGKCSPRQKDMVRMVLKHIYTYRRTDFDKIMQMYDIDGKKNEIIAFMNQK